MITATIQDIVSPEGKNSRFEVRVGSSRIDFEYINPAERQSQHVNARAYLKQAIQGGCKLRIKELPEKHK